MRGRDQLGDLVPARRARSRPCRAATCSARAFSGSSTIVGPGLDRVARARERLAVEVEQHAAHVRVAHAQRRVDVPAERGAARAAARLVLGHVGPVGRVVGLLRLPGDDPVLDVDLPRAGAGAVDAVRRADDLVVLPAVAVERLPLAARPDERAPAGARARRRRRSAAASSGRVGSRASAPRSSAVGALRSSQTASARQTPTNTSRPTNP